MKQMIITGVKLYSYLQNQNYISGNFDQSLIDNESKNHVEIAEIKNIFPIEEDDEIVLKDTKHWVQKVIADFAVCPFTIDPNRAGIPLGGVRYSVSRATNVEEAFLRYWEEVQLMMKTPEKDIATVLLVFPELLLFGNYELFEAYCDWLVTMIIFI